MHRSECTRPACICGLASRSRCTSDPDILIVDEVLAVGDEGFSLKCLDKFAEFKRRGKTILLVTHGLGMVERFCDEAVWLDHGRLRAEGDPRRVVGEYLTDVEQAEERLLSTEDRKILEAQTEALDTGEEPAGGVLISEEPPADMFRAAQGRWGPGLSGSSMSGWRVKVARRMSFTRENGWQFACA